MTEYLPKIVESLGFVGIFIVALIGVVRYQEKKNTSFVERMQKELEEYRNQVQNSNKEFNNYLQASNLELIKVIEQNSAIIEKISSVYESLQKSIELKIDIDANLLQVIKSQKLQ
jgi:sugar-specific transcriptional regulator TrmB